MAAVKAMLWAVSDRPGAQDSSTLGRYEREIVCRACAKPYYLEYNPRDLQIIPDGMNKLVRAAEKAVNDSHQDHPGFIPLVSI